MDSVRKAHIANFAEKLRNGLNLNSPVDLQLVVSKLGGRLEEFREEFGGEAEAYVRKTGDSFAIATRYEGAPKVRERFSIAHEIGHLFVHLGYKVDPELWNSIDEGYLDSVKHRLGYNQEEFEANEFAASLLMPKDEFVKVAKLNLNGQEFDLDKIADHFGVSRQAAKVRGQWLGIFSWR